VVNVANCANVDVRLITLKLFLGHISSPFPFSYYFISFDAFMLILQLALHT